jgi:hypothetical protein
VTRWFPGHLHERAQSGDPLGKGACLTLAFFRVRISATVSPAEFCTILLSFFWLILNGEENLLVWKVTEYQSD